MSNYEDLKVWQRAVELSVAIYKLTLERELFRNDFGLKDQVRRASISIPSNISEGDDLGSDKQAVKFFFIAKGSAAELFTQITISFKIGYITEEESQWFQNECKGISGMLTNLIKSRSAQ